MVSTRRTRSQTSDPSDTMLPSASAVSVSPRKTRSTRGRASRASTKEFHGAPQSICVSSDASQYTSPVKGLRKVRNSRKVKQDHDVEIKAKDEIMHSEDVVREATSPIRIPLSSVAYETCPSFTNSQFSSMPTQNTSPVVRPSIKTPSPKKCQQKFQSTPRIPVYRSPQFDALHSFATVGRAPRDIPAQVLQGFADTPITKRHKIAEDIRETELSHDGLRQGSCPGPDDVDSDSNMSRVLSSESSAQPVQSAVVGPVVPARAAAEQESSSESQDASVTFTERMTAQQPLLCESVHRDDDQTDPKTAPVSPTSHDIAPKSSTPQAPITPELLQSALLAIASNLHETPRQLFQPHLACVFTPTTTWIDGIEVPLPPDDWSPVKTSSSLLPVHIPCVGTIVEKDDSACDDTLVPKDMPMTEIGSDLCPGAVLQENSLIAVETICSSPDSTCSRTLSSISNTADVSETNMDNVSPDIDGEEMLEVLDDPHGPCMDVVDLDEISSSEMPHSTSTLMTISDISRPVEISPSSIDDTSSQGIAHQAAEVEDDHEQSFSYVIRTSDAHSDNHSSDDTTNAILGGEPVETIVMEEEQACEDECVSLMKILTTEATNEANLSEIPVLTASPGIDVTEPSRTDTDAHGLSITPKDESIDHVETALPVIVDNVEAVAKIYHESTAGLDTTLSDVHVCNELVQEIVQIPIEGPDHILQTDTAACNAPAGLSTGDIIAPAPVDLAVTSVSEISRQSLDGAMELSFIDNDHIETIGDCQSSTKSSAQPPLETKIDSGGDNNNSDDSTEVLESTCSAGQSETAEEVLETAEGTATESELPVHTPQMEPLVEKLGQTSLEDQMSMPTMYTDIVKKPKKSSSRRQSRRQSYMTATKTAVRERELEMLNAQDARDAADLQFAADLEAAESLLQEMPGSVERRRTRSRTSSISRRSPPAQPKELAVATLREISAAEALTMSPVVLSSQSDIQPIVVTSEAAIKIQALFRGWRARRCLDEQRKEAARSSEIVSAEQISKPASSTRASSDPQALRQSHNSDKASIKEHDINDVFSDFLSKWQSKKSQKVKNEEPVIVLAESPVKATAPATPRRVPVGTLSPSKTTGKTMVAMVPSSAQKGRDAVANPKETRSRLPGPKSGGHGSSIPFLKSSTRNLDGRRALSSQSTRSTGNHTTSPSKTAPSSAGASVSDEAPRKRKAPSEVLSQPNLKRTRALQEPAATVSGPIRPLLTESTSDSNLGLARSKTPPASTLSTKSAPVTPKRLLYLTPAEVTKTTRNFTSHNRLYRCDFDRVVIRKEVPRPPSPTAKLQARMAMNARSKRKKLMKEKGYTFGAGDDEDYVPKHITPERRAVKWQENLEIDLQTLPRTSPSKVRGVEEVQPCIAPAHLDDYGNLGDGPPLTPELGKAPKVIITKYLYRGEQDD